MAKSKNRSQYLTTEPNWAVHSLAVTEEERYKAYRDTSYFIHQEIADRESYKAFRAWVKTGSGWSKDIQERVLACPDWCYLTIGQHTWFASKVGYMPQPLREFIDKKLEYLLKQGDKRIADKTVAVATVKVVAIRPHLGQFLEAFDECLDYVVNGRKHTTIESLLNSVGLNAKEVEEAHKEISNIKQEFDELARVRKLKGTRSDWDDQLVEAYAFINTPNPRKTLAFMNDGLLSLETFKTSKKVVRRKKPQDPRKVVSRLRYMKADKDLGIASINPIDILGSTEVWTYDIKRKRLGVYKSQIGGGLHVHGTSIQGYDTDLSYEKTLRKHEVQLQGFMKLSKKAIQDYVGKIRGKQMPVKTRINPNMLLLKVQ